MTLYVKFTLAKKISPLCVEWYLLACSLVIIALISKLVESVLQMYTCVCKCAPQTFLSVASLVASPWPWFPTFVHCSEQLFSTQTWDALLSKHSMILWKSKTFSWLGRLTDIPFCCQKLKMYSVQTHIQHLKLSLAFEFLTFPFESHHQFPI